MNDQQIDEFLQPTPAMPPALTEKITAQIKADTVPAGTMMSGMAYGLIVVCICVLGAVLFASTLGPRGWHALKLQTAIEVICVLSALAFWSAAMLARSMRPGTGRLYVVLSAGLALIAYEALVLTSFRDYSTALFLHRGLACLGLGVLCASVAALPVWFVVRRGFVVEAAQAGALMGLVGGLAGLAGLTLHCDLITAPHTSVWHAAVVLVCVCIGWAAGRILQR